MKISHGLFGALFALALAGCANPKPPDPNEIGSGGAAATAGPGYCEKPPADMTQMDKWNELCDPGMR